MTQRVPRIAVTMGDPGGIGPEVIVKALGDEGLAEKAAWRVLGPMDAWERAGGTVLDARVVGRSVTTGAAYPLAVGGVWPAHADAASGRVSLLAVQDAVAMAKLPVEDPRHVDAIVTGPICKEAWALAGHGEGGGGHTEMLAAAFGAKDGEYGMFFHAPGEVTESRSQNVTPHAIRSTASLNVMLATVHVPLARVPGMLTVGRVVSAIRLGHEACVDLGIASPKVAVCGLNPHAGEGGLLGREDEAVIRPAVEAARELGMDVSGPHPGDTVFNAAVRGEYDLVVAMYHDQGLIPVKLLAFDRAVNVTVGLRWDRRKIVRTSPDHGTAFGIAGRGLADAGSMKAAIELAVGMRK
jgi:4-hydroxythreonine-4-phosphate dehydrogenase